MAWNNSFSLFKDKGISGDQPKLPLVIVADNLSSPMNVGAVLRLAANLNAEKTWFVYEQEPGFRSYKIKSTSSGASEKTDWEYITPEKLPEVLPGGYEVIAIETTDNAENIYSVQLPEKLVLIVGNERLGISEPVLKLATKHVFIPVPGPISSLNVSHALAVGVYEWYRQQQTNM
ncbi:MAG: TrmH family RNA methyltransferase [Bacteroidales bacterium]|nr:TrmH family RNA methyltransferase [Bacteroidales bacterium]